MHTKVLLWVVAAALAVTVQSPQTCSADSELDANLMKALEAYGFPKDLNTALEQRLGRKLDPKKVDLGRSLFFDRVLALSNDNSCAGCHAPRNGFGDTQSIAIGVDNNYVVGPSRCGPRNQRRTPMVLNNAFYPKLMWNGRFASVSGDPFDNSSGFEFPPPEGVGDDVNRRFPSKDPHLTHLLMAQAQIPSTELPEMANFRIEGPGADDSDMLKYREPRFAGIEILLQNSKSRKKPSCKKFGEDVLPHGIGNFFNEPIRGVVVVRLNAIPAYVTLFKDAFPGEYAERHHVTIEMVGQAIAEFEFSLTFVDAPVDRFRRHQYDAMTDDQKRGGLLFFGKARCVECHTVAGKSAGMFSDFENHVIGVPQVAPRTKDGPDDGKVPNEFGNVQFAGPGNDEDFGLEDITRLSTDRYKFRTSPLRNIHLQTTFGHNGAWSRDKNGLERVIRHHLNPSSAKTYSAAAEGLPADLQKYLGPIDPVLARLSPRLATPITLTDGEVNDLVCFVRDALADPNATEAELIQLIPKTVPSGLPIQTFE